MSKVSTDAKSNPEFIKPNRREMPFCKDNHICVHGSDYQFAKSLSCIMRNVEQNARICLLMGTWLDIFDITHVILCGDDRFIMCAGVHLSASFACMYAIGQIAKQFFFVSSTSQKSLPVRRNRCSFKHALSVRSATARSMIDCFRLFVRYLSHADNIYSANSFKLRVDIWKNHFLGILLKCRQALGLTICTIAAPSKTLASIPR